MSTRSVIAREVNGIKGTFKGVYHHWDGYPAGVGAQLYELYHGHFNKDREAMLEYLIDRHPAGWSSINGADFNLEPGFRDRNEARCAVCNKQVWRHYRQYYAPKGLEIPAEYAGVPTDQCLLTDHAPKPIESNAPECYCHGGRGEGANPVTDKNASDIGCEYAYVFAKDHPIMYVLSSYTRNGDKMIGMFGMGDPKAEWRCIAVVNLDEPEPRWDTME